MLRKKRGSAVTTIYVDVFLFENLWMNTIILYGTATWLGKRKDFKKILLAALTGAIYALWCYGRKLGIFESMIGKILLSLIMIKIAFSIKSWKELFKTTLLFYLVSFLFGGCVFAWSCFLNKEGVKMQNGVWKINFGVPIILISAIIGLGMWQIRDKRDWEKTEKENL